MRQAGLQVSSGARTGAVTLIQRFGSALNLNIHLHMLFVDGAYRVAIGPHAGRKALVLYSLPPLEDTWNRPLVAQVAGFSLHAATVCEAWQRSRLERLCRYITRPPIATKRLSVDDRGRVVYQYKHPFRDGSTHVLLEPLDFMFRKNSMPRAQGCAGAAIARLAALVPRPRPNRPAILARIWQNVVCSTYPHSRCVRV